MSRQAYWLDHLVAMAISHLSASLSLSVSLGTLSVKTREGCAPGAGSV
jgi:hypothetical protein